MQSIIDNGDTTALMVSHSLQSVRAQCNKVLWLDKGRMVMFGDPNTVCDAYAEYLNTGKLPQTESLAATQENPRNRLKKNTSTLPRPRCISCCCLLSLPAASCGRSMTC